MSTGSVVRDAVASALDTALSASWSIYKYPTARPATPFALVSPRSPYRDYATFGRDTLHLAVHVVVTLGGETWLDAIDTAVDLVMPALGAVSDMTGLTLANVSVTPDGGSVQAVFELDIALPRS